MRIKLIANPISGGDARPRIAQAVDFLSRAGAKVDLCLTARRGDARVAAASACQSGYDRILAAGGDGTLNEVVNGVFPGKTPVAFLPLGTVNVFALEAGIPFELLAACRLALEGLPRHISLGRVDDEAFLLMASVGWDAEAVARLRPRVKKVLGRLAYGVSAVEALLNRPPVSLEIELPEGRIITGYGVVISNCRFYGGRYVVTPQASLFRDTLEVCVLRRPGRMAMLGFAANLLVGRRLRPPAVEFYTVHKVRVRGASAAVQVDGDAWGHLPINVESLPQAVSMVLPEAGVGV